MFTPDWLITNITTMPAFTKNSDNTYTLSNGLISRTFTFSPGFGTVDFYSFNRQASLLRAIDVEGYLTLDNITYPLGGIMQATESYAYINKSDPGIVANPQGWDYASWSLSAPVAPFPWTPGTRGSPKTAKWPPEGLTLSVNLKVC